MKPLGPIPAGYTAIGGELAIGGKPASHWGGAAGRTPLFVYSKELIAQCFADLRAAMPERIKVNYAIKANSFSPLRACFDASGRARYRIGRRAGNGPGNGFDLDAGEFRRGRASAMPSSRLRLLRG